LPEPPLIRTVSLHLTLISTASILGLLRLLESHTGIVILTTNRISDFDEAFHSRIHVSLEYGLLTVGEKLAIWHNEVSNSIGSAHAISGEDFKALAQLELDGRVIHNVVHVLRLYMGPEDKQVVSLSLIKEVLKVVIGRLQGNTRKQVENFCQQQ
jgi:hypothetical protein